MELMSAKLVYTIGILLTAAGSLSQAQGPPRSCSMDRRSQCTSHAPYSMPAITSTSNFIIINTTMCPPYDNPHWTNPAQACQFMTTYRIPLVPKEAGVPIPLAEKLEVYGNITYLKENPKPLLDYRAIGKPDNKQNRCRTGEECECEEFRLRRGAIGVMKNGVNIFGVGSPCGYSSKCPNEGGPSQYVDAIESEGHTVDQCGGHPAPTNQYHIHSGIGIMTNDGRTKCGLATDIAGQHSPLLGWLFDGYGMYGQYSLNGDIPTDLDQCGGHSHMLDGVETYHYHLPSPSQFPWTVGCYKGCPELSNNPREFEAFTDPPYNCPKT